MSIYTSLVSGIIFPLHELLKRHTTVRVRKDMERSQWLPHAELEKLQLENLRDFLTDVGRHVPYYRSLFKELDFDPVAIASVTDLQRLPLTGKPDIRAHTDQLKADDAVGLSRFNTGGSSGEPLVFYIGSKRVSHDVAAKWRATRWWDVDIGDPEIVVWGSPIELGAQDRIRQIRDRLIRTKLLPAFEMSEQKLDGFVQEIRRMRPKMLFGYPSALSHIATHAQSRGVRMDELGIKVAFVTSERLYDHQREKIQAVFGCQVANGYGGRDAGFIAHQCPQGGMHITEEDIIVEIVGQDGNALPNGAAGEIVITHLATRDFPFIRYRTGDVGVMSDERCPCGRGLPLLKEIQGRATDFVVAQDGTVMHGLALIYIVRDLPGIEAFKVIQENRDLTRLQVVRGEGFDLGCEQIIIEGFRKRLGQAVEVRIEYVDAIPKEASGKFRYIVSHAYSEEVNKEQ